jgi:hypothetical protein
MQLDREPVNGIGGGFNVGVEIISGNGSALDLAAQARVDIQLAVDRLFELPRLFASQIRILHPGMVAVNRPGGWTGGKIRLFKDNSISRTGQKWGYRFPYY